MAANDLLLTGCGGDGAGITWTCDAADFDGTNDYLTRGSFNGAADSKTMTVAFWVKIETADGTHITLSHGYQSKDTRFLVTRTAANTIQIQARSGSTLRLSVTSTGTVTADGNWHHIAFSCDLADTGKRYLYIDGAADAPTWATYVNANVDQTLATWTIGASQSGGNKLDGGLAEFFWDDSYLDLSANILKFRSSGGKPVFPGSDGSGPFGFQPMVYVHLDTDQAAAQIATNNGTGGNYTVVGSFTTFASSPSD